MDQKTDYQAEKWTKKVTMNDLGCAVFLGLEANFRPHQSSPNSLGGFGWEAAQRPPTQPPLTKSHGWAWLEINILTTPRLESN
jgi:hypothetical protein